MPYVKGSPMNRQAWDYRFADIRNGQELARLGALGWEAVGVTQDDVLLKRPAPDFREQVTLDQRRRYFGYWGLDVPEEQG